MARLFNISDSVLKALPRLPKKHLRQVLTAIVELTHDPQPHDAKPLTGDKYKGFWRKTVGEYRIIYRFDDDLIDIMVVGKRNDDEVYKQMDRKS